LKDKINELATNNKNKNIRDLYKGIIGFKKGYQPRNNLVKDENGDLLADSHNILNSLKMCHSLATTLRNQNLIQEEIKRGLTPGNACYHSVQNVPSSRLLTKKLKN
jgi:hypothetical protein